jgi:hypothetical protein
MYTHSGTFEHQHKMSKHRTALISSAHAATGCKGSTSEATHPTGYLTAEYTVKHMKTPCTRCSYIFSLVYNHKVSTVRYVYVSLAFSFPKRNQFVANHTIRRTGKGGKGGSVPRKPVEGVEPP